MMNPSVRIHSIDNIHCAHVKEDVHQQCTRYRCEEDCDSKPTDRFLISHNKQFLGLHGIQEEMSKNCETRHAGSSAPGIPRIPTVLASIGDAKEHIS